MYHCLLIAALAAGPFPEPDPFSAHISAPATVELGKIPAVKVAIRNLTGREALLVGSLDASDCRWRYPHSWFEVTGPDGQSAVGWIKRCKQRNPLRERDFVAVKPGASFDPSKVGDGDGFVGAHQLRPENFAREGVYRIRFHYSTDEKDPARWQSSGPEARLLERVPRGSVRSNEITVRVVKPVRDK